MAFKRVVRLLIAPPGTTEGIVISDLDMEFRVIRSTTVSENTAEFVIYGANEDTRNNILVKDATVEFSAGYRDSGGAGLIFVGNVITSQETKLPTTWQVNLTVSNIKKGTLAETSVTLTYAPDTAVTQILNDLAAIFSMVVYGIQNADGIVLPNGLAVCTTARNALIYVNDILELNGKGLFRDNDEIIIFSQGIDSDFDIINLKFPTLVSVAEYRVSVTKKKAQTGSDKKDKLPQIEFSTLLLPQIRPNGLIQISDVSEKLNGRYVPTTIEYVGDNMDGPFNCNGRADKLEIELGVGPVGIV